MHVDQPIAGPPRAPVERASEVRARLRRRPPRLPVALLLVDAACAVVVAALSAERWPGAVAFAVAFAALLGCTGCYRPRIGLSILDDLPMISFAALGALGAGAMAFAALGPTAVDAGFVAPAAALTALVVVARAGAYAAVRATRRAGTFSHRTLIVGCGGLGAQLAEVLACREHGLATLGFVDDDPRLPPGERPLPVLGGLADLPALIRRHGVAVVLVGYSNVPEAVLVDVLRSCDRLDVEIYTVPRFWQVHSSHRLVEVVRGVPLVRLRRPAFRALTWPLKRVVDVVLASVGLVAAAPLMAACALAVRAQGGPGVLFRQERIGMDGRRFEILKFRSLAPATDAESATRWSVGDDERLRTLGRWMRRLSLDELPQLWNVLRGDMSLVGPRPERPHFVERFGREHEEYLWRLRVPCGLTGWAQVNGLRGDTSISDRARYDNHYIENWSLWLDAKVLLRTVRHVLRASGA